LPPKDGLEPKYIVIPIGIISEMRGEDRDRLAAFLEAMPQLGADEFFVLRRQDAFAASALHGYAHIVQSILEVAQRRPGVLTPDETDRLNELADKVSNLASHWQTHTTKIPD
jgi:hypothetical protein